MRFVFLAVPLTILSLTGVAHANLVANGDFETSAGFNGNTTNGGQIGYNTNVSGWTVSGGYGFVFTPGSADSVNGVPGQYGGLALWGANNGGLNAITASPTGGNFVGLDGAFQQAPLQQTVNGLVAGNTYALTFYWAGAQQYTYSGATTESFTVSLGGQTLNTATVNDASHGFTGWTKVVFNYTATASSEVLSFLANGTPNGEPPFSMLDGVDLEQTSVPEPSSLALMAGGLGLLGFTFARRRRVDARG
jgi:hypothetical protein